MEWRGVILSVSEISLCKKVLDPSLCSGWQEAGRCHVERKRNIPLRKELFCSFLSFCCDQKERNATKERKNAAKTKSGIFLLKLWKSLCSSEFQQKNSDFVIGWEIFIRPHFEWSAFPRHYERKRRVFEGTPRKKPIPKTTFNACCAGILPHAYPQKTHLQTTFNACCAGILPMSFLPKRGAPRGDGVSYWA